MYLSPPQLQIPSWAAQQIVQWSACSSWAPFCRRCASPSRHSLLSANHSSRDRRCCQSLGCAEESLREHWLHRSSSQPLFILIFLVFCCFLLCGFFCLFVFEVLSGRRLAIYFVSRKNWSGCEKSSKRYGGRWAQQGLEKGGANFVGKQLWWNPGQAALSVWRKGNPVPAKQAVLAELLLANVQVLRRKEVPGKQLN